MLRILLLLASKLIDGGGYEIVALELLDKKFGRSEWSTVIFSNNVAPQVFTSGRC